MNMPLNLVSRRKFLLMATCSIVAGHELLGVQNIFASNDKMPEKTKGLVRWGILINANACPADCNACVNACNAEHRLQNNNKPATDPQWIRKIKLTDKATGLTSNMPVMCQHCTKAECVKVCPTGASYRRADGVVLVNRHLCIGCRYCMMACPFKARNFVHEPVNNQANYSPRGMGTVEGCNMCIHRIDAGRKPACVEACAATKNNAMTFGNMQNPTDQIAKNLVSLSTVPLRPDLLTDPGVRYYGVNP